MYLFNFLQQESGKAQFSFQAPAGKSVSRKQVRNR